MEKIKDIGERGLLNIVQEYCPVGIVGDDAAILDLTPGYSLVVTSDVLTEGVHFSDVTTSPEDVGWRAGAANLSDLAAMGAEPLGITVGLSVPPDLEVNWVERVYGGLSDCLRDYNTPIVGGDICRAKNITLSIAAFGQVKKQEAITRFQAEVGDNIVITGYHGLSKVGLEILLYPEKYPELPAGVKDTFILAHRRPRPRLDCLPPIREIVGEHRIAGMDSSDGLADAILQICRCSRVGAIIDALPLHPFLNAYTEPETALNWTLYGGEDFELVLCLPPEMAGRLVGCLGGEAAIIGRIVQDERVVLEREGREIGLDSESGFKHFG